MFGVTAIYPASANDLTPFTTVFDTDFTAAGVGGLRGTGSGTLNVTGIAGPVSQSYLYWAGPTNSTDPNINANVTVAGQSVTGTNIGFSQDNFWGFTNSQAYQATTTSIINANGNYALSNFNKLPTAEVNGAGALIFYNNASSADNRDVWWYIAATMQISGRPSIRQAGTSRSAE
jgi:hypothetical protein